MKRSKKMEMEKDYSVDCSCEGCGKGKGMTGCGYFLGFIGAAIYNISVASGFWGVIIAILKAAIWPAYLVYKLFSYLG